MSVELANETRRGVQCEFCESQLSASGELIKRSAKARAFLDLDDDNAKLRARVETLQAEIAGLKEQIETLRTQGAPRKSDDDDDDFGL